MLHEALDRAALAGRVAALEQHDDPLSRFLDPVLNLQEFDLKFGLVALVDGAPHLGLVGIDVALEYLVQGRGAMAQLGESVQCRTRVLIFRQFELAVFGRIAVGGLAANRLAVAGDALGRCSIGRFGRNRLRGFSLLPGCARRLGRLRGQGLCPLHVCPQDDFAQTV